MGLSCKVAVSVCYVTVFLPYVIANEESVAALRGSNGNATLAEASLPPKEPMEIHGLPEQKLQNWTGGNLSNGSDSDRVSGQYYRFCPLGCYRCGYYSCCCYSVLVCFPGEAEVLVRTPSQRIGLATAVAGLKVGQEVLSQAADRTLRFEPVLGFLHYAPDIRGMFRVAVHERGQLRATAEHLVFILDVHGRRVDVPMKGLRVGDRLLMATEPGAWTSPPSRVLAVHERRTKPGEPKGMFAPLTASGTVVVDGAIVSVYAGAAAYRHACHGAYHALFFPLRVLALARRVVGENGVTEETPDEFHPAVRLFANLLGPLFAEETLGATAARFLSHR